MSDVVRREMRLERALALKADEVRLARYRETGCYESWNEWVNRVVREVVEANAR